MKKIFVAVFTFLLATASFAQDSAVVRWRTMLGVTAVSGNTNPVSANIDSGTFAWNARGGHARVNLFTGATSFDIEGLVINGTSFSGTPGPVNSVTGTVVCNPGTALEQATDTPPVNLSSLGNARFSGVIPSVALPCSNPLFLIRIFNIAGARGRWIATGAERVIGDGDQDDN